MHWLGIFISSVPALFASSAHDGRSLSPPAGFRLLLTLSAIPGSMFPVLGLLLRLLVTIGFSLRLLMTFRSLAACFVILRLLLVVDLLQDLIDWRQRWS